MASMDLCARMLLGENKCFPSKVLLEIHFTEDDPVQRVYKVLMGCIESQ